MKCISILQPWASLVVTKDPKTGKAYKQIETRSWNTKHRGPLLIHASKRKIPVGVIEASEWVVKYGIPAYQEEAYPTSAIIGMVNLVDTFPMETAGSVFQKMSDIGIKDQDQELAFGDYSADRYGWLLSDPIMFKNPIPCKGSLSIWNLPGELEEAVQEQIRMATAPSVLLATPAEGAVIVDGVKSSR